jgi:hypothetical protein
MHNVSNLFYFRTTLYIFRTVSPSIIRSLRLYIQHQAYVTQVLWLLAFTEPVWNDAVCTVLDSWWWTERPSETCRVLFQNKINLRYCASGWFHYRNVKIIQFTNMKFKVLTLILVTWKVRWVPNNASRWQMGFNSGFKGLNICKLFWCSTWNVRFKNTSLQMAKIGGRNMLQATLFILQQIYISICLFVGFVSHNESSVHGHEPLKKCTQMLSEQSDRIPWSHPWPITGLQSSHLY